MSSICGIIHFDGAPVDPDALHKMADAAAYSGPDGTRYCINENAGFAHLALHTTPEAKFEQQPLWDSQSGYLWVADARVDNREELIELLRKTGDIETGAVVTDVELFMWAYRHWGIECLSRIYGNYAFVMWDAKRQRILAGRDFLGLRPMFYMRHGQTAYFASTIRSILAVLPERPPLNELLIADYYRYNFGRWVAETIYLPIRRLPAACLITLDAHREDLRHHWMITNAPILRYKHDQEYYDQFLNLFQETLKACTRTSNPLAIQVSGGIDSSAITCTLHKMWAQGKLASDIPSIKLYKLNFVHDPSEEESCYHNALLQACPEFSSTVISGENYWGLKEIGNEVGYHLDEPEISITRCSQAAKFQRSRNDGCSVTIQGIGGDELFNICFDDIEFLQDLPISSWLMAMQSYYRRKGLFESLSLMGRPILDESGLRPFWRRRRKRVPTWLRAEWLQQLNATPVNFKLSVPDHFASRLQRVRQMQIFTSSFYLAMMEYNHHIAVENGTEVRYPFLDRRLIEYVFRLPTEKLLDFRLILKPFLKKTMTGILPEKIMRRTDKSNIGPTVYIGLRKKERIKVRKLLDGAQKHQAKYISFQLYEKNWNNFLEEKTDLRRSLFTPLTMQAWIQDNGPL